jgi:hypothetical protein
VDQRPQDPRSAEPVEVSAALAQPAPSAQHAPDAEAVPDESVGIDTAGEEVAPGAGEVQGLPGPGHLVEDLGGDQGQVVVGAPSGAG